jgi:hypothetical protein
MFRSQKSDAGSRLSRQSLPAWEHTPTLEDVQLMLDTSQIKRGAMVDVMIKRETSPVFVLTCQWDKSSKEPVWSLYEGEDGSKTCWTYKNDNLEMIYEIICMTLPGGVNTSAPSKLIGRGAMPAKKDDGEEAAAPAAPPPAPAPAPAAPQAPPMPQQPGMPYGAPPQGMPMYPQQMQPGMPGFMPGYPQPGQPYPQGMPPQGMPPQGMPMQGMPPQGMPMQGMPPQGMPMQGMPPQGMPPQPGFVPGQPYPPGYPNQQNQPMVSGQMPVYQPQPGAPTAGAPSPTQMNNYMHMMDKGQKNVLLGQLFVEAGILPEPCVDAALKLQELVRKGLMSDGAAIEAMRKANESGGILDDEIINACRAKYPNNDSLTQGVPVIKTEAGMDPREFIRQVIQLIQQAGIVTENDVATAEGVRKKHGGDVGTILVAAGKIERATLDSAKRCQPLVREHRLNHEEAYRILRHCQKNRSSVEEACAALSISIL